MRLAPASSPLSSTLLRLALPALLALASAALRANPAGGDVASGSATIVTVPGTVTVNQLTNKAIINWQTFSIGAGELTKFIQPSSASATLNRVLGGQTSIIDGTLSSNGQVYLLNGNGILIGPSGVVNTGGFTASTRDITDGDFNAGNLHFAGAGDGGVANLGSVSAIGGDVIFIGKTVDNEGQITAAAGHVGLAAADDVLISQSGMEHVFVSATAAPSSAAGLTGVNNSGTIIAAAAELKAANGNIYALATNNSGIIRATGVANENGHIWLVADQGVTQNTGTLAARGADGGGGVVETSGGQVIAHGTVDAGAGGSWLIDPTDIVIDAPTATTIVTSLNAGSTVTEDSSIAGAGSGNITVSSPITWTGTGTLDLYAYANLTINAGISATAGTLNVKSSYNGGSGTITTGASGTISVATFAMQGGSWLQNTGTLPAFSATNFSITGGSFLRASGGSGTSAAPYQVSDVYGLQGIGSSGAFLADAWRVSTTINASGTSGWNGGAGFVPIGTTATPFTGTFNGNGDAISGLFIHTPAASNVGLFGDVGAAGSILDVIMTGAAITGLSDVGELAGTNAGSIETSNVAGAVSGTNSASSSNVGGFVGLNSGPIDSSFTATTVTGYGNTGGFVGSNSGLLTSDYSTGNTSSFLNGTLSGANIGGFAGINSNGSLVICYTTGNTTATDTADVGGLVGTNTGGSALVKEGEAMGSVVTGYSQVGGLAGSNAGGAQIVGGMVLDNGTTPFGVTGTIDVGGMVGNNSSTVTQSSVVTTHGASIKGKTTTAAASNIGGFVGTDSGTITDSFALVAVAEAAGTTNAQLLGGFAGFITSAGSESGIYATGNVTASGATKVGGLVGENDGTLGVQSNASGNVTGAIDVGGLIGDNIGTLGTQSFASGTVNGTTFVGGLIGINTTSTTVTIVYARGNVTGTSQVGGLIGSNVSGNFSSSTASGNVSGTGTEIGGLMGHNGGTLTLDSASGNVTGSSAGTSVGGLVGDNSGSILSGSVGSSSFASGTVSGNTAVGGLVGTNSGSVGDGLGYVAALADYTHATGNVSGISLVGGLIGDNLGAVSQASASGAVNGSSSATTGFGGLIGRNDSAGTITTSFSTSTVQGNGTGSTNGAATDSQVGGLVGTNLGAISKSYATGNVVGDANGTGGLVGFNNSAGGVVQTSYSTGNVTGLSDTGGLVGYDASGTVTQNYSTSTVVGTSSVGGLVGFVSAATVSQNYSTGSATGTVDVGGLAGQIAAGGTVTQSYATGAVAGTTTGGLVGTNGGTVTNSYWDGDSTGQGATGFGGGTASGATELTSTSGTTAFASASYTGFGSAAAVSGAASNVVGLGSNAWYMLEGSTRPYLAWEAPLNNPVTGGAHLIYTAHQLQLVSVDLSDSYVLGQSVSLAETQQASGLWNTATGFVPIGTSGTPFSGSFSGGTFGISNLYINTASLNDIGLFGTSSGSLSGVSLSGNVTGNTAVGLLVGNSTGPISGARLSGSATGTADVGGLAGASANTISSAAVNVAVHGGSNVGGIVGSNSALIEDSYSLGAVVGTSLSGDALGGIAGINYGTVTVSYETGNVSGPGTTGDVGGAVGANNGTISQTYATGDVNGSTSVGGVAGSMNSSSLLTQSYSTGTVTGLADVGGITGYLNGTSTVTRSYASGGVTGTSAVGGDIGDVLAGGAYSNLYWDTVTTTQAAAIGTDGSTANPAPTNLHGDTINANTATYAGLDSSGSPGFTTGYDSSPLVYGSADNVWRIQKGSEFPFLTQLSTQVSGVSYSNEAHTLPATGATVTFNSGGNLLSTTTTDGSGDYDFLFAADNGLLNYLPLTNATLRVSDAAANADSIAAKLFNGNGVPDLLANLTSADTWGATVRVVSSGLTNALMGTAGSSFVSTPAGNAFGGTNLAISENFDIGSTAGSYSITGDITSSGDFTVDSAASVPTSFDHPVTLDAAGSTSTSFTQNAVLSSDASSRAIIVESTGNYLNNVGTGAFVTPGGTWIVYSQNPPGSGQSVVDDTNGLNQLHLYGTDPTNTPAYHLDPGLDYQIYSFTPTITLTATASASDPTTLIYGAATPALQYIQSGLLPGDTITAGQTFNQVLSNQPGEQTTYAQYSNVGTYPVTFIASTLPKSLIGYNIVFAPGSIIVDPASGSSVTIDVSGSQKFGYIGGGATFSFSATGTVAGDPNFHPTFTTTVGQFTNVAYSGSTVTDYPGTISLNAASLNNYTGLTATVNDLGFTVIPANLTVTATGTSIYGNTIVTPTLSSNSSSSAGTIYDDSGTGSTVTLASQGYSFTNASLTPASNAGNYVIAVMGSTGTTTSGDLANYNVTINPGTYAVTPRPVTVNATTTVNYVYDGTVGQTAFGSADYAVAAATANTGLVNGDTVTGNMGRAMPTNGNVGLYLYNVGTLGTQSSAMVANSGNYTFAFADAGGYGFNITPLSLTVGILKGTTAVYGAADPAFTFANGFYGVTSGALASGDGFTAAGVPARQSGETVNGGATYQFNGLGTIGIATSNGAGASTTSDYSITFSNPSNFGLVITKAPLTVTANNDSKTYNGLAFSGGNGVTYSAFQYADGPTAGVLGGALSYATGSSQGAINVGSYAITPSGYSPANYAVTYVSGTLQVNAAPLTITADPQSKVYGATDPTLTATIAGLVNGEPTSEVTGYTLATTTGAAATAGTHPITVTGGTASNYSITDVPGVLTVSKANLTVTATNNASTTYGTAPIVSYVVGGTLYYGDTASVVTGVTLLSTFGINPPVGTYSATPFGGTAANYNITDLGVTNLTVTPATLYATANNQSKVYGGLDPTLSYTLSGALFYGDTYSVVSGVTVSGVSGAAATVGTHPIVTAGGIATNYTVVDVPGTLTVTAAPLTVTANNQSKVYGGTDPTLTYTPSGTLYYGDSYGVISGVGLSTTTGAAATAGTHPIVATGGTASNYAITDVNGTLSVSKASLTVTANNQTKTYGGADPTLTDTIAGLLYGDTASVLSGVTLSTATGAAATAGTHVITAAGGTAANYTVTDVNGVLTVNPATLTLTADPESKLAGEPFTFLGNEFTSSGLLYTDTATGATLTSPGTAGSAIPGTYAVAITPGSAVGTGLSNYTIVLVPNLFVVVPSSLGQLPLSWLDRSRVDEIIGTLFDPSYGERMFYELEVPGTIHRTIPSGLDGIGVGSSLWDVRIGLEDIYSLDRFQSFRH